MTTLGAPARRPPDALPSPVAVRPAAPRRQLPTAAGSWVRIGTVELSSAFRYLLVWAAVLFGVLLVVLGVGYLLLAMLGVTGSVSRALAVILDQPLPSSGVLPVLQARNVLPAVLVVCAALSALWFVCAAAAVLVHNAVSALTGGVRVRLRGRT